MEDLDVRKELIKSLKWIINNLEDTENNTFENAIKSYLECTIDYLNITIINYNVINDMYKTYVESGGGKNLERFVNMLYKIDFTKLEEITKDTYYDLND